MDKKITSVIIDIDRIVRHDIGYCFIFPV